MRLSYLQAVARAIHDSMAANSRVVLMGSQLGGHLAEQEKAAFAPIHSEFGDRVYMDVPIAEFGLAGAAVGLALAGARPLLSFNIASFMLHGLPPLVNEAPNVYYTTGGQSKAPVTCYALGGIRGGGSSQHSHRLQAMMGNIPGLQVFTPATATDAYGLLKWCLLESQNPTIVFAHSKLLLSEEEVDVGSPMLPVGTARICREGGDVTVVAHSVTVPRALEAAEIMQSDHGIAAEVIDLRTLVPLDRATLIQSAAKTGHVVIADECHRSFGVDAELASVVSEEAFGHLKSPVVRVATEDVPIPYNLLLEEEISVTPQKLVDGAVTAVKGTG